MKNKEIDKRVLNDMIQINGDRIQSYSRAIDKLHPKDEDLKAVFTGMSRQSANFKAVLRQGLQDLGEDSTNATTGKIAHTGMDTKVASGDNDRQTVLNNCEAEEDAIKKAYEMALNNEGLSLSIKSILESQQTELRAAHSHIKELRDSIAK